MRMPIAAVRSLSIALVMLRALPTAFGQTPQPTAPAAATPAPPQTAQPAQTVATPLKIAVLEGENAVNSIPLNQSVTPIVEIRDDNEFPLEGATVVFTLPSTGPGGFFPGNQTTFTTRSDLQGQASTPFLLNGLAGRFVIKVNASLGNRTGQASITQTNTASAYIGLSVGSRPWYKKWRIWAIAGGVAATGAVVLIRRRDSTPTIVFTPGGPVFGGPR